MEITLDLIAAEMMPIRGTQCSHGFPPWPSHRGAAAIAIASARIALVNLRGWAVIQLIERGKGLTHWSMPVSERGRLDGACIKLKRAPMALAKSRPNDRLGGEFRAIRRDQHVLEQLAFNSSQRHFTYHS